MQNPFQDWDEVYFALCKRINTPHSLACWLSWKGRSFTQLEGPRPSNYDSAAEFGRDYLVYSWASKSSLNLEKRDLKKVALDGFIADEEFNRETDARIRGWMLGQEIPAHVERALPLIQRKIASILGPCRWLDVFKSCRFGNGATSSLRRRDARFDKKMSTLPLTVSPDAYNLAVTTLEADPNWASVVVGADVEGPFSLIRKKYTGVFELCDYNTFDTVPKSLKTARTIAKEPVMNGFLQQGAHAYLRKRLASAGVDLRNQEQNQILASLSQSLELATLDARSASNSITTALVELLLPVDWFALLDILRSRRTVLPGGVMHDNYMFSSMGNAFTFELESLIFYAILTSVSADKSIVSVYGDDMILPQCYAVDAISLLESLGFRINREKSFISGRFFESCGKHYFDGIDVTPAYQKEAPRSSPIATVRAANRLIRWAVRQKDGDELNISIMGAWMLLMRESEVPKGPMCSRDDDWYVMVPSFTGYNCYLGRVSQKALVPIVKSVRTRQAAAYAYWLRCKANPPKQRVEVFLYASATLAKALDTEVFSPLELSHVASDDINANYRLRRKYLLREELRVELKWPS